MREQKLNNTRILSAKNLQYMQENNMIRNRNISYRKLTNIIGRNRIIAWKFNVITSSVPLKWEQGNIFGRENKYLSWVEMTSRFWTSCKGRDILFEYKLSHLDGNIFTLKKSVLSTLKGGRGNKGDMLRRLYNFWEIKGCPQMISEQGRIVLEEKRSDESEKWDIKKN